MDHPPIIFVVPAFPDSALQDIVRFRMRRACADWSWPQWHWRYDSHNAVDAKAADLGGHDHLAPAIAGCLQPRVCEEALKLLALPSRVRLLGVDYNVPLLVQLNADESEDDASASNGQMSVAD